jgi:hypothetical protein
MFVLKATCSKTAILILTIQIFLEEAEQFSVVGPGNFYLCPQNYGIWD